MTRRRPTEARVIDAPEGAVLRRHAGVSQASKKPAEQAITSDAVVKRPIPRDPVLGFNSVDERFIDFLVEEALNEWRAKNF